MALCCFCRSPAFLEARDGMPECWKSLALQGSFSPCRSTSSLTMEKAPWPFTCPYKAADSLTDFQHCGVLWSHSPVFPVLPEPLCLSEDVLHLHSPTALTLLPSRATFQITGVKSGSKEAGGELEAECGHTALAGNCPLLQLQTHCPKTTRSWTQGEEEADSDLF
ncbi:hypothetical protein Nmel_014561 [Mimus melanotis]